MYSCDMFRCGGNREVTGNDFANQFSHYQSRMSTCDTATAYSTYKEFDEMVATHKILTERNKGQPTNVQNTKHELTLRLENEDMWKTFNGVGTEMIVTKVGRRVFPTLRVLCEGLLPEAMYTILVDVVPVDNHKYKYHDGDWVVAGSGERNVSNSVYVHPDSPAPGSVWMRKPVSFHKLKLTNNKADLSGNIIVNTMQKYQIRIQIVQANAIESSHGNDIRTMTFPETTFIAVTAYQSEELTKMKINNNPFARSFRDPSNAINRRTSRAKRKSSMDEELEDKHHCQDTGCSPPGDKKRKTLQEPDANSLVTDTSQYEDVFSRTIMTHPQRSLDIKANEKCLCSTFNNFSTVLSQEVWNPADCPVYERNHFDIPQPLRRETLIEETRNLQFQKLQSEMDGRERKGSKHNRNIATLDFNKEQSLLADQSEVPGAFDFDKFVLPSYCQHINGTYPHTTGVNNLSSQNTNMRNYPHDFQLPPNAHPSVHNSDGDTNPQNSTNGSNSHSFKFNRLLINDVSRDANSKHGTFNTSFQSRHLYTSGIERNCEMTQSIACAPQLLGGNVLSEHCGISSIRKESSNADIISSLSVDSTITDRIDSLSQRFAADDVLGDVTFVSTNDVEAVLTSVDKEHLITSSDNHLDVENATPSSKAYTSYEKQETELSLSISDGEDILREAIQLTFFSA